MANQYGSAAAEMAGYTVEFGGFLRGNLLEFSNMDLWNNNVGREIGLSSTSKDQMAQKVFDALNMGKLITDEANDPRNYFDDYPHDPFPDNTSTKPSANVLHLEKIFVTEDRLTWYEDLWDAAIKVLNDVKKFGGEIVTGVENFISELMTHQEVQTDPQTSITTTVSLFDNLSLNSTLNIEHELSKMHNAGNLDNVFYDYVTQQISDYLVSDTYFNPNIIDVPNIYDGFDGLSLNPIGAFYESVTPSNDPALSIADKTFVLLDRMNKGLTASALASKDTNRDGKLSGTELTGLNMWRDLNENGVADTGEITTLASQNITTLRSEDYGFHTKGNTIFAPATLSAPSHVDKTLTIPASNYRSLRDTDNVYYVGGGKIYWAANQVKINYNNRSYLIGTDGNDSFDAAYYASYTQYFNSSLLVNFLAGEGNDLMGGSARNDNLWGGTGNDVLLGYAGDDKLYGEEGDDELQGQIRNLYIKGSNGKVYVNHQSLNYERNVA